MSAQQHTTTMKKTYHTAWMVQDVLFCSARSRTSYVFLEDLDARQWATLLDATQEVCTWNKPQSHFMQIHIVSRVARKKVNERQSQRSEESKNSSSHSTHSSPSSPCGW